MPCPANAASPCKTIPNTESLSSVSLCWSCFARTLPITTGATTSKWDGFAWRDKWTFSLSNSLSAEAPIWYLTSPDPPASSGLARLPKNSEIIALNGLFNTLYKTFNLPLWAMPITTSFKPNWLPLFKICSIAGTTDSEPSNPNLFVPAYFLWRNCSNVSAPTKRSKIAFLPLSVNWVVFLIDSILSWIHAFCAGSWTCINSTPIEPQYVSLRISIICFKEAVSMPNTLSIKIGRSQSSSLKP